MTTLIKFKGGFDVYPSSIGICEEHSIDQDLSGEINLRTYPFSSLAVGQSAVTHKDSLLKGDRNRIRSNIYRMNAEGKQAFVMVEHSTGHIEVARIK